MTNPLPYVVESRNGPTYNHCRAWEPIAAFNHANVATRYARDCRADSPLLEYRVVTQGSEVNEDEELFAILMLAHGFITQYTALGGKTAPERSKLLARLKAAWETIKTPDLLP